jgi:hypothetical protein
MAISKQAAHDRSVNANVTRKLKKKQQDNGKSSYNAPGKNGMRDVVISYFDPHSPSLFLESKECACIKAMPFSRVYIFEILWETAMAISQYDYPNVKVFFSDVVEATRILHFKITQAWFDFCNTFDSNKERIEKLRPFIERLDVVAFTFSFRGSKPIQNQKTLTRVVEELREMYPLFKPVVYDTYSDTSPMMLIIMRKNGYDKPSPPSKSENEILQPNCVFLPETRTTINNNNMVNVVIATRKKHKRMKCKHCNYEWTPKVSVPKQCPKCKQYIK